MTASRPASSRSTEGRTPRGGLRTPHRAGMLRRIAAACLDAVVLATIGLLLVEAWRHAGRYSGAPNEALWFYPVGGLLMVLAYQFVFLAAMQSTPGMAVLRISVATADGRPPAVGQIAIRVLVSLVSAAAFALGYIWALSRPRRQTWHDLAADTVVIVGSPRRPEPARPPPPRRSGSKTYDTG